MSWKGQSIWRFVSHPWIQDHSYIACLFIVSKVSRFKGNWIWEEGISKGKIEWKSTQKYPQKRSPKIFPKTQTISHCLPPQIKSPIEISESHILIFLSKTLYKNFWCPGWRSEEKKCQSHSLDERISYILIFPCMNL